MNRIGYAAGVRGRACWAGLLLIAVLGSAATGRADVPSPAAGPDKFGRTNLPEPVPYLNRRADYFIGNGTVGAGGPADGSWTFLAGPDYTCPNYLGHEELSLVVDGKAQPLILDMHRARETGLFYGGTTLGDLRIELVDYAIPSKSWIGRLVRINNRSDDRHTVSVRATILPAVGAGRTAALVHGPDGKGEAVSLGLDTSLKCVVNAICPNWASRHALIAFDEAGGSVTPTGNTWTLESAPRVVASRGVLNLSLIHYLHYAGKADGDYLRLARHRNSASDVETAIHQWKEWFDHVGPAFSLGRITDQRGRDVIEGGLAILKMNQTRDGGMVANEMGWDMSYVRDAYCGLRGLEACGHFGELKAFLLWQHHKFLAHHFIANANSCGSDIYAHPNGNNGVTCAPANADVEVTALYLLMARDYFRATHDLATLKSIDSSLKYAMDIQLKEAVANGYKLEFSGDETELCNAVNVAATGYDRDLSHYWSMTSIALCAASLDFYIDYIRAKGGDPANYENDQSRASSDLVEQLPKLQAALEADYWRTNLPSFPDGFHDWFRVKRNGDWPAGRIVNFTLFPLFYGTPLQFPGRARNDVRSVAGYFDAKTGLLPLMGDKGGSLGHDLGYLLWGLVQTHDTEAPAVYSALVSGPTVSCWGTYNEAYDPNGMPNGNSLRSFETGVNISALAKYLGLGNGR